MYITIENLMEGDFRELNIEPMSVVRLSCNLEQCLSDLVWCSRDVYVILRKEPLKVAEKIHPELKYSYRRLKETVNFVIVQGNKVGIKKTLYYTINKLPKSLISEEYFLTRIHAKELKYIENHEKNYLVLTEEKLDQGYKLLKIMGDYRLYERVK